MKKILITIITLITFVTVSNAQTKSDVCKAVVQAGVVNYADYKGSTLLVYKKVRNIDDIGTFKKMSMRDNISTKLGNIKSELSKAGFTVLKIYAYDEYDNTFIGQYYVSSL
ncbi:hypothetical protein KMW28_23550 [Flammeovirga yaeyamensis]|uniref:Uncharacterized protein n=1 Tax=Flammeovirga yaeyamensis TaxID=367791 RepID=A0AAX1NCV0_9BACT|nr:hypothetical protein [Flammeovirga yaeyamensis]MBB3696652.1 hypothetical protein [Flammeovirga yaeyamensis]NMF33325.1 hypothetical protein [Flammeovirga yaeyamensis]QWG05398.1 hypothetical protein KMW28_23550 [Flammeovirga yaeyamensis]